MIQVSDADAEQKHNHASTENENGQAELLWQMVFFRLHWHELLLFYIWARLIDGTHWNGDRTREYGTVIASRKVFLVGHGTFALCAGYGFCVIPGVGSTTPRGRAGRPIENLANLECRYRVAPRHRNSRC